MMATLRETLNNYYVHDFWAENGDKFVSEFYGMGTPWPMLSLALSLVAFCIHFGPRLMATRKAIDLKPIMLILDGFAFGTYTVGVSLYLACVNLGYDCFYCDRYYKEDNGDIRVIGAKVITYILVLTKVFDFNKPVMSVLAKQVSKIA